MNNMKIREEAKRAGVYLWEVAERWGCNDGNFSRKLRRETLHGVKRCTDMCSQHFILISGI